MKAKKKEMLTIPVAQTCSMAGRAEDRSIVLPGEKGGGLVLEGEVARYGRTTDPSSKKRPRVLA